MNSPTLKELIELLPYLTGRERAEIDKLILDATSQSPQEDLWFLEILQSFNQSHPLWHEVQAREALIVRGLSSPEFRRQELERCREDVCYWMRNWVWTYDPRLLPNPATIPFIPWPKQEEYLRWRNERIERRECGLVEKSRDSGLSWLNVSHQCHRWLFFPGWKGTIASRKETYVDRLGDPDSLMEKFRIILRYLPSWMRPKYSDGFLKIINLDNGSTITGETGYEIGRGGRSSAVDIDEAAFLERADRVDAAVSQNAQVVIWTSTPRGKSNLFAKKRFSGKIPVFRFHWRDDPRKDEVWYEREKGRLDAVILAQEIDINYDASDPDSFIPPVWIAASDRLSPPEKYGQKVAGLDIGLSGDRTVLIIRQGPNVIHCESWRGLDTTQTAFKAVEILKRHQCGRLVFDADGIGAGVAGTLASIPQGELLFHPLHGSGKPSNLWWPGERKRSHEKFYNRRAEVWGIVRDRFQKTYNLVEGLQPVNIDDTLIFTPSLTGLLDIQTQLSFPRSRITNTGKIQLESKAEMTLRGIDSPDYADALCYAFAIDIGEVDAEPKVFGSRSSSSLVKRLR